MISLLQVPLGFIFGMAVTWASYQFRMKTLYRIIDKQNEHIIELELINKK